MKEARSSRGRMCPAKFLHCGSIEKTAGQYRRDRRQRVFLCTKPHYSTVQQREDVESRKQPNYSWCPPGTIAHCTSVHDPRCHALITQGASSLICLSMRPSEAPSTGSAGALANFRSTVHSTPIFRIRSSVAVLNIERLQVGQCRVHFKQ